MTTGDAAGSSMKVDWDDFLDLSEAAFDDAPVGMALALLDDEGNRTIHVANRALARFLGTTPDDLLGVNFNDLTHPDDRAADLESAAAIRAGAVDTVRRRKRYLHADGTYRWAELNARALRVKDDSIVTLAHILDISDRIELERAQAEAADALERMVADRTDELARSETALRVALDQSQGRERQLELVLDATKAAVGEWNMLDGTLLLSDSWYRLLGYEPGTVDLTDGPWQAWVHPDDWPELQRLLEESEAAGQRLVEHTLRVRHRDGTWRWNRYRGVATEWTDAGRPARMLGIALDVTEQRSLEQQLVHSAKMQSLGAFAGGIAHDFNNVLAIVQGHTEALERSSQVQPLTDDQLARIEAIQRAVRRATSLVRSLMLLNRPSATSGKVTDLADLLHRTAASLPYLLGEDVRLDVTVPPYPVVVPVDEGRLEAALLNLAANARDAMPAGGTLTMVLDAGDDPTPSAVLRVTDTGVGMDDNTLASIFEPFFTTKMPGVGTGLGMATTYATITEANGTITATSTPGNGATITIVLPIVPVTTSAEQVPPMLPTPLRPSTSLLVVEDEAELLELTTELLEDQQFRVHSALDADEALETLERYDDIALVITDAVMPGMSGPELASIIRERWPQIPLLFMSGYSVESPATLPFGDDHVLTKPVTSEALIEAVARVLQPDGNRRDRP